MKAPVSVLVPVRNEEINIAKCLRSLQWADEVYVVDSASADRTVEIAGAMGAHVVQFRWNGQYPKKYNWALENIPWRNDWVLVVDADEEVTDEVAAEIAGLVRGDSDCAGYIVRFNYYLLGNKISHGDPLDKLILFRHRETRYENIDVPDITGYDIEMHEHPMVQGRLGRLKSRMIHHDYADLSHHLDRHNLYSDWEALLRTKYKNRSRAAELLPDYKGNPSQRRRALKQLFLSLPGKPVWYFIYGYIIRGGFMDGKSGFAYNMLKSIHWYMVGLKEYEIKNGLK